MNTWLHVLTLSGKLYEQQILDGNDVSTEDLLREIYKDAEQTGLLVMEKADGVIGVPFNKIDHVKVFRK